jgi:predicted lipoprotein with Yx(FWY)xxD motif
MKRRFRAGAVFAVAAVAGAAVAAVSGVASAKGPTTLQVAHHVSVAGKTENIVVDAKGVTLYMLSGNTARHPGSCTRANGCFDVWPPATVHSSHSKVTAASGIHGKLSIIHRDGVFQLVLGTHPLYRYFFDHKVKGKTTGEGFRSFGGTWHVIAVKSSSSHTPTTTTTTPTGTTTTTTTPTIPYP